MTTWLLVLHLITSAGVEATVTFPATTIEKCHDLAGDFTAKAEAKGHRVEMYECEPKGAGEGNDT